MDRPGSPWGRRHLLYGEEIARCPELGEVLEVLEQLAATRNRIREAFGSETPDAVAAHLGQVLNGQLVTEETVTLARSVDAGYQEAYKRFTELLAELAREGSPP